MNRNATMKVDPGLIRTFLAGRERSVLDPADLSHAAVLLLLFEKGGVSHVLLTKRTSDVEHHKGQISFPGGSVDEEDDGVVATALREAEEEIGLPASHVEVLGLFDDSWTPSGFRITPVIGYAASLPGLLLNPVEVEAVLEVPINFFLDGRNERKKEMTRNGKLAEVYFFTYGQYEIWGATAAILRSFLHDVDKYMRHRT